MASGPIIIGHRGASGYRPEHTLESYRLAIAQGADVIEPDLVLTRDGVLVVRHENEIGQTTDVADKYPERRRSASIDGAEFTGWFIEDFTVAEIKTLRARERLSFRPHDHDGRYEVPTFEDVIRFVQQEEQRLGRRIGIYPETKHPSHHEGQGLPITATLLATLDRFGYREPADPAFIQSFETANLRQARNETGVRLVQLIEPRGRPADFVAAGDGRHYADLITARGLEAVAEYADGVGVAKDLVQPIGADGKLESPTALVDEAHRAGLFVHVWTLRADPEFLPAAYGGDAEREVRRFAELGVDGVFTDFPDVAARALGRRVADARG
ncbi:MAG: glycerophosphodiester phosphodiesterase [Gemmatimonadales bacterium]